ncbi:hypothetical protein SAMN04488009_0108 [Maribacter sedimenticola]|uniref:Uncharacterized protein n=1 Tax=Maribacter sedimenticola TaxID=228956 RepID=A0ABY1SM34_9FLAO|nr:hypothetical protein [Maribacter sedimenticola]SNR79698.1 hypothetical protein SAMN04488009_0108 [Maribacter sedimenticola]
MNIKLISLFFIITSTKATFSQVNSAKEAEEVLSWIIENPQIETDSIFSEQSVSVFKWQALNHSEVQMRVTGISEFMDSGANYKFFKEITMIYMLSEFMNQINGESREIESALIALNNVLNYYKKVVQIDTKYKNPVLEEYVGLSEKHLRKKIKKLKK